MGLTILLALMVVADLLWWRRADARLRPLRHAWPWRAMLAGWAGGQAVYLLLWLFVPGGVRGLGIPLPLSFHVAVYLWHLLILPPLCLLMAVPAARRWLRRRVERRRRSSRSAPASLTATDPAGPVGHPLGASTAEPNVETAAETTSGATTLAAPVSRRQLLAAATIALPPLVTVGVTARAVASLAEFRVRAQDLFLPNLPPDLDGLTIAQVTDLHLGRFTGGGIVPRLIDATNALSADLIVFTGDLIDYSQDDLPAGIDFIRSLKPRHGPNCLVMIEGNHDLLEYPPGFEQDVKDAGLPLLIDEAMTIQVPGRRTPVQCLGLRWGQLPWPGQTPKERTDMTEASMAESVARVKGLRDPDAFPILLSHHPHAWDPAADAGFPLVLSGHTHGGQIMLTDHIGGGPLRFRYWTGTYRKPHSQLFISNGVGNWFPLRVNAPMEIVKLTLKRG